MTLGRDAGFAQTSTARNDFPRFGPVEQFDLESKKRIGVLADGFPSCDEERRLAELDSVWLGAAGRSRIVVGIVGLHFGWMPLLHGIRGQFWKVSAVQWGAGCQPGVCCWAALESVNFLREKSAGGDDSH